MALLPSLHSIGWPPLAMMMQPTLRDVLSAGAWWFWLMALANVATCCWVTKRAWRSLAFTVDMILFMVRIFGLLARFIWAMEFGIEHRLSSLLRAAAAP